MCTTGVLVPTANEVIEDGKYSTGLTSWDEFLRGTVGLASSTQNFDANGAYARAATAANNYFVGGKRTKAGTKPFLGATNTPPQSTRPVFPQNTLMTTTSAPWKFDSQCTAASYRSLNAVKSGAADGSRPGQ